MERASVRSGDTHVCGRCKYNEFNDGWFCTCPESFKEGHPTVYNDTCMMFHEKQYRPWKKVKKKR